MSILATTIQELNKCLSKHGYFAAGTYPTLNKGGKQSDSKFKLSTKKLICFSYAMLDSYRRICLQGALSQTSYIQSYLKQFGIVFKIQNFQLVYKKFISAYTNYRNMQQRIDTLNFDHIKTETHPVCMACRHDKDSKSTMHIAADGCFRSSRLLKENQHTEMIANPLSNFMIPKSEIKERLQSDKTKPKTKVREDLCSDFVAGQENYNKK